MKKRYIAFLICCAASLVSCLKDKPAVDFGTVGVIIEILPVNGGGLENFDAAELSFDPADSRDSAIIVLNIASPNPLNKALTVTTDVNDALRTSYNAANGTDYEAMPDSIYSFPDKSGNIQAGNRLDTLKVYFYPSKADTSRNYMLPVSIKDAQGQNISGNFGSIYFHINKK